MPEPSQCPSCNAKVRVPQHMLGKKVRCPKCQATFTAGAVEPEEPAEPAGVVTAPTPAVRRRAVPVEEREDEESERYEDEDRPRKRRRPMRRSRRFDEAAAAVAAPAICFMVLGGLNIAWLILDIVLRFLDISLLAAGAPGQVAPGNDPEEMVGNVVGGLFSVFGILLAVVMIFGGYKMKRLENYGLAMAVTIFAILPCWNCCLLGLPLGIWSLIVLNRPEVKVAFT
jgi:predicted Zn finger-like uncharacterized protein